MEQLKIRRDQQLGLMEAMDFSDKDLDANRSGILSDDQRIRLHLRQWWGAVGWWMLVGIGTVALFSPSQWFPNNSANRLACLVIILIGLGMAFWRQETVRKILQENRVAVITGTVLKTHQLENNEDRYRAFVGSKTFSISLITYDCLQEGMEYNVYYLADTDELLAIELPLIDEEAGEKAKRLVEPDTLISDTTTIEDNTTRAHLSEDK